MQTNHPMHHATDLLVEKLDELRTELADLAFGLECRGQIEAADVANMIGVRLSEIRAEIPASPGFADVRACEADPPGDRLTFFRQRGI